MANNNQIDDWQEVDDWQDSDSSSPPPAAPEEQSTVNKIASFLSRGLSRPPMPDEPDFKEKSESFVNQMTPDLVAASPMGGPGPAITKLARALGISKIPGVLMEKSLGNVKNAMPGLGQSLIDQGVVGTRGMMRNQIASKLPQAEQAVQSAVSGIQGEIRPGPIAEAILEKQAPYMAAEGVPAPSGNRAFIDAAARRAEEAASRGSLTPEQALQTSRAIAKPAYARERPLQAFKHQISQAEAAAIKDQLKGLSPEIADALSQERALIQAQKALNKPSGLFDSLTSVLKYGTGAGAGGAVGGPIGAAVGAGLTSPAGLSASAHGLNLLGKGVKVVADPAGRLIILNSEDEEK